MLLYIHVPFCIKKCSYCDFLSFPYITEKWEPYVSALCREIKLRAPEGKVALESIYLGGGTPSILPPEFLEKIFKTIHENFSVLNSTEVTIECNPKTVSYTLADTFVSLGINRVSIGLQSADADELKLLGRAHNFRDFLTTYEFIAKSGIENINVDLMTGLPKQTIETLDKSLKLVCGLRPTHISTYSLILEPDTVFSKRYREGIPPMPTEDEEYDLYRYAIDYLTGHGYERYEISNYAREGNYSRHNLGYWERKPYIGAGLGASSFYNSLRLKNTTDLNSYISLLNAAREELPREFFCEVTPLSKKDEIEEFMYLGLRKTKGILLSEFEAAFGESLDTYYHEYIEALVSKELMSRSFGQLRLTSRGTDISNQVLAGFLFD